ncbi:MAG: hybrid sensor histidine kinase/response regulator, partial [Odoribacteraceae bacterium]|nr:hybrid sensor histidine kinase/response regulator [Odoribacteraceae bacterium]
MKPTLATLILCALVGIPHPALPAHQVPQSGHIFSTMTVDNGLPHNFIDDIFKDSRGFIWLSTGGGLVRHDSYEMLVFNTNSAPVSLKSNAVKKVCEDDFERLWVISSGGLDIIDLVTMRKSNLLARWPGVEQARDISLLNIFKDKKGNLWLQANEVIYRFAFAPSGRVQRVDSTDRRGRPPFSTLREVDGAIYAGNDGKIFTVNASIEGGLTLQRAFSTVDFGENVHVSTLVKKENAIWIGTENGLFRYNINKSTLDTFVHDERRPGSISQNMVTDILLRDDGQLIVATLRGLNFLDISNDTFERVSSEEGRSLNNDFINCLMADGNHLWIGTEAGGVNKMTLPRLATRDYVHDPDDPSTLSKNLVNALLEDSGGTLWVGAIEGGLNRKHPGQEGFTRYSVRHGLAHNSVSALEEDGRGRLWVGTWGGGISILKKGKGDNITTQNITLPTNYVGVLARDTINRGIWIGTNRGIYFRGDTDTRLRAPLPDPLAQGIWGTLGSLVDRQGNLWIGTSAGLVKIKLATLDTLRDRCEAALFTTADPRFNRTFLPKISFIYQTHDGVIWLGSDGYGICKLDGDNPPRALTTADGLPNNTIFGILEDDQGRVWISTARGLSCHDPATGQFSNYNKEDGLLNNQFYW